MEMFVFDIDGTLLTSREEVLPATLFSLQKVKEYGHKVVLCTGRTWACTQPVLSQVSPYVDYIICGNGSHIRTRDHETLYDNNLPPHFIKRFIELVFGFADFLIATNQLVISTSPQTPYHDVSHCIRPFDSSLFHDRIHAKNLLAFNLDQIPVEIRSNIRKELEDIDPRIKLSPLPHLWEVLSGADNKATALKRLSELTGIPLKEVTAFGDNYNDIEMFKIVGNSVAMGNAPKKVKNHALYVTASNDEDGIYRYLSEYVFES